ncbi:UNVERIFIED_CONTAM: hypothetical protein PYX00_000182 [Menopon gallinae]|uniref:G-protein coupled receptors family 1 profile domain-containing protein n=1 Tax=Menopon gallinae TaxID=328185 RepID=A0AAW2I814_9NEOP
MSSTVGVCNTTSGEYIRCPNTRCIRKSKLCDGICDCIGETPCYDESDCEDYYTYINGYRTCKVGATISCKSTYKGALVERCISPKFICDGENDCHNGFSNMSDEYGCFPEELAEDEKSKEIALFHCGEPDKRQIPMTYRCDYHIDCLNGEDEENCDENQCGPDEFRCINGQCIPYEYRCDAEAHCHDKSDEGNCTDFKCPEKPNYTSSKRLRQCENGQCIPEDLWCDFTWDCSDGSDEKSCGGIRSCTEDEFQCLTLNQCIPKSRRCFLDNNPRLGCADGSHLLDCMNYTCPNNTFECTMGICLDMSLVCDGKIDCVESWIDEENCTYSCFNVCHCIDTTANCTGLGLSHIQKLDAMEDPIRNFYLANNNLSQELTANFTFNLRFALVLDLSNNSICSLTPGIFRDMQALKTFILQNNCLTILHSQTFDGLASLNGLHLEGNHIQRLEELAFYGLSSLPTLNLRHQGLNFIAKGALRGLRELTSLDLSHNSLEYLCDGTFHDLSKLTYLDLRKNPLQTMGSQIFVSLGKSLQFLVFDNYKFCCLARNVPKCEPTTDEFSSCEDLMSNFVLRICIWVLGISATLGNLLVIGWRIKFKHSNRVHSFLITNLAIGDLLMGFYLILIAITDAYYRGVYSIHDEEWRNSRLCSLAGFLSTLSSELSVFTLTVITLDRFLVIIFPFKLSRLEMNQTRWVMLAVWIFALVLSGLPLLYKEYFKNFYGRSAVCLALHITTEKRDGWKYSVFVFVFLNLVSFSVIAVGYLWMYGVAKTTRLAVTGRQAETKRAEAAMARRMTLIVVTDAACWVPIIFLGIISLCGVTVPSQVFAWVAVFVLPLNAAINPILYTIATPSFLDPATRNIRSLNRSCKLSLSNDPRSRRTYSTNWGSTYSNNSRFDTYLHYCKPIAADRNDFELINVVDESVDDDRRHSVLVLSGRIEKSDYAKENEDSDLESTLLTDAQPEIQMTGMHVRSNSGKCLKSNRLIPSEPQINHRKGTGRRKPKKHEGPNACKPNQRRSEKKKKKKIDHDLYD